MQLSGHLTAWVEEVCGQPVSQAHRIPGGASREAWVVTLGDGQRCFLRHDTQASALSAGGYDLAREARVYEWLAVTPVRAAAPLGLSPDRQATLYSFVEGAPGPMDDLSLARDFMGQVNELHHLDPPRDLPGDDNDMAVWTRVYRQHTAEPDPLVDLGLRWLADASPGPAARNVLVHGDLGPGNVLHDGTRVTALCDWELAHVGDPMEDLAWITVRAMLTPFVDIATAFGWYEGEIHPERLRYWQVACQVRNLIGLGVAGAAGGDLGMRLLFDTLHRRVTAEVLCDAMGVSVEPPELPPPDDTAVSGVYAAVLDDLRSHVVPALEGYAAARAKSVARLVRHLDMVDRIGRELADQEEDDRNRYDLDSDTGLACYLARCALRQTALMRPAMGRLADAQLWRP